MSKELSDPSHSVYRRKRQSDLNISYVLWMANLNNVLSRYLQVQKVCSVFVNFFEDLSLSSQIIFLQLVVEPLLEYK